MILRSSYFMFLRMLRGYLGLILLIALPLALITVLGFVAGSAINEDIGIPVMDYIAILMVLSFQLFGGSYTLEFMNDDLLSKKKWRMYSLPIRPHTHAYSILLSTTIFGALQGFAIVIFTKYAYGVNWGNILITLMVLFLTSLLSQMVCLVFVLSIKKYKSAERMSELYGFGSMALAGVWFPPPNIGIFIFLSTYGNPISLAQNVIYANIKGQFVSTAIISLGILIAACVTLSILAAFLGRRKLA